MLQGKSTNRFSLCGWMPLRFGGMKFIVMNSTLLRHPEDFADEIKQQEGVKLKALCRHDNKVVRGST